MGGRLVTGQALETRKTETMPQFSIHSRRAFAAGALATAAALALPGCATTGAYSFTEAIRRLLVLSSERAFARLAADGGYWDSAVERIGLPALLGGRGDVINRILTSGLFKSRVEDAFADIAVRGSYRVAPIVADTVRTIGIENAVALIRGGPSAATEFLRGNMGQSLIEAMVPEVSDGLRLARDPLVGQLLGALAGVDLPRIANNFSSEVDRTIWNEIGIEEGAIRRDPEATRDPLLIAALKVL
jgi:hypothetical protein